MWTGLCLRLTATAIVAYRALLPRSAEPLSRVKNALSSAEDYALAISKQHANYVRAEFESALNTARTLAQPLSGIKGDEPALELDRDAVNGLLKIVAVQNPPDRILGREL